VESHKRQLSSVFGRERPTLRQVLPLDGFNRGEGQVKKLKNGPTRGSDRTKVKETGEVKTAVGAGNEENRITKDALGGY